MRVSSALATSAAFFGAIALLAEPTGTHLDLKPVVSKAQDVVLAERRITQNRADRSERLFAIRIPPAYDYAGDALLLAETRAVRVEARLAREEAERQAAELAAQQAEAARQAEEAKKAARVTASPPPPPPAPPQVPGDVWGALAMCESGNTNANTGNGYYGYFQFLPSTWRSVGGTGLPTDHGYGEQLKRAQILQARSGWGQWPACSRKLGLR